MGELTHISSELKQIREQSESQENTQSQTLSDIKEPSPDEILIAKLKRFNISCLEHTFDNFEVLPGNKIMFDTLKQMAQGTNKIKFALCYGQTGNGKTYLFEAVVIEWAKRGILSRYQTASQILRRLKNSLNTGHIPDYESTFESFINVPRLIIDDISAGTKDSIWELSVLEDIINERYHKRYYPIEMVTLIATNKDITELPDRIVSRFYDPEFGVVLYNKEDDYRRRKI